MKKGWETKRLGDLAEIELGKTPARATASFWDDKKQTNNVWLSIADLLSADNNVVSDSKEYLTDKGAALCNIVHEGTLLVSFKLTLGRLAFAGRDLFTNEAIAALTLVDERQLSKEYLFWFLQFFDWEKAAEGDVKIKGKTLNKAKLKYIPIEFPATLAEQKGIVGMLDEAFAELATAQANAEKNLQNARALFESQLQSVFTQRGKSWVEDDLQSLTSKIGSGATPLGGEVAYKTKGISLIRSLNVYDMGFRYEGLAFLDDQQADRLSNVVVEPRDVLLNITGASVARCCVVPEDALPARVNQHVSIIRPIPEKLRPEFLHYLLISAPYKKLLLQTGEKGGSTRQAITKAQIQQFRVAFPKTLEAQNAIVEELDALSTETQRLARIYEQKQAALAELKKSLLHQAFSGNL